MGLTGFEDLVGTDVAIKVHDVYWPNQETATVPKKDTSTVPNKDPATVLKKDTPTVSKKDTPTVPTQGTATVPEIKKHDIKDLVNTEYPKLVDGTIFRWIHIPVNDTRWVQVAPAPTALRSTQCTNLTF
jgi:hypothetical protein